MGKITPEDLVQIKAAVKDNNEEQLAPVLAKLDEQIEKFTEYKESLTNEDGDVVSVAQLKQEIEAERGEWKNIKSMVEAGAFGAPSNDIETKSFGELVTEHEAFNEKGFDMRGISFADFLQKDITSISDCGFSLGVQSQPTEIKPQMTPKLGLVDCITIGRTRNQSHRYIVETGYAPLCGDIVIADSTESDIALEPVPGAAGFMVGHEITIGGHEAVVTAITGNVLTIDPPLDVPPAVEETTYKGCTKEVQPKVTAKYSGATPEKMLKPKADLSFESAQALAKKIARWICVSDEAFRSLPRLQQYINMRLRHFMRLTLEWHLAYGNGENDQLLGFCNVEGRQVRNWSQGSPGDNKLDALKNAKTLLEITGFGDDAKVFMNPYDYDELLKMKDSQGRYLANDPFEDCIDQRIWCMPIVTSSCFKRGKAIVANVDMAFSFFEWVGDGSDTGIRTSNEDRDNFITNSRTILTETHLVQECCYPEAIVEVNFDTCPPEAVKPEMPEGEGGEEKVASGSTGEILDRLNALEAENAALKAAATATKSGAAAFEAAGGSADAPEDAPPSELSNDSDASGGDSATQ